MTLKLVVGVDDYNRIVFSDKTILTPYAEKVKIGTGTYLSSDLEIGMPGKLVDTLDIGDNCRIYAGQIAPRKFICGDYVTIHRGVWCYGREDAIIGHNSWFGMRCTLDAEGGFSVGNGFGAGQDTHLWSHIRHGDVLDGCRFLSFGKFIADDDVWFVGRCTSGPYHHASKSVALTESNVVGDMEYNHIYGGNPAKDLTDKIGNPYRTMSVDDRESMFLGKVLEFIDRSPTIPRNKILDIARSFDVIDRTYIKTNDPVEVKFMRFLLPEAKFIPRDV